ncbi:DUF4198 domain-containing protein [Planctomicrobium sp. SH668]|uniref:DUF4198 domain-containing protein n=1 Tax=Planctomicrobium sp. SH668 TaxID=3448126 RepID=UPI003F5C2045
MPRIFLATVALVLAFPLTASAHKLWLLPSKTVVSGENAFITVDGAVSNDLFYFDHRPLNIQNVVVTSPSGEKVETINQASGNYRSVFDFPLQEKGTYQITLPSGGLMASWVEDGEPMRFRGNAEDFAKQVPADAQNLRVSESVGRCESFVTFGKPSDLPSKEVAGITLSPITHPNDLFAGEESKFRLLIDGAPASGLEVTLIQGGTRYRNDQSEIKATTDSDGVFTVTWPEAGMYWMEATSTDKKVSVPQATQRSLRYIATLEVLPQ